MDVSNISARAQATADVTHSGLDFGSDEDDDEDGSPPSTLPLYQQRESVLS